MLRRQFSGQLSVPLTARTVQVTRPTQTAGARVLGNAGRDRGYYRRVVPVAMGSVGGVVSCVPKVANLDHHTLWADPDGRWRMDAVLWVLVLDREIDGSIGGPAFCFSAVLSSSFIRDSNATSGASHSERVARMMDNGTNEPLATE